MTVNFPVRQPEKITMIKIIADTSLEGLERKVNNFILQWRTVVAGRDLSFADGKWILLLWYTKQA